MTPPGSRLRRIARAAAALAAALLLAWGAGFAVFVHRSTAPAAPPDRADGIVALTGGTGRVEAALHLLADGRARVALLSGVGGGVEFAVFAHRAGLDAAPLGERVTLGRAATSTRGNAVETAAWARENRLRSLIVVTSGYHMPRALTELERAVPEIVLYPAPVLPPAMRGPAGMRDLGMARLMLEEYTKWLAAWLGLSGLVAPDAAPNAAAATAVSRPARAGTAS